MEVKVMILLFNCVVQCGHANAVHSQDMIMRSCCGHDDAVHYGHDNVITVDKIMQSTLGLINHQMWAYWLKSSGRLWAWWHDLLWAW